MLGYIAIRPSYKHKHKKMPKTKKWKSVAMSLLQIVNRMLEDDEDDDVADVVECNQLERVEGHGERSSEDRLSTEIQSLSSVHSNAASSPVQDMPMKGVRDGGLKKPFWQSADDVLVHGMTIL
mgnify:CR=1 FL=1